MSAITVATANIYWYGLTPAVAEARGLDVRFFHTEADDTRLARMLFGLGADVLCLQEIVDVARFERVLGQVSGTLALRDAQGQVLASADIASAPDARQRTLLAWNTERLALLAWQRLPMWTRAPVVATFQHWASGRRLRVVGAHAKSSAPEASDTAGQTKRRELETLATWASDETAAGRLGDALLLGDFNSTSRGEDARHLRRGALESWRWTEAAGDPASLWTTTTDRVVIDHILASPALAAHITAGPEIVYFDRDPAVPDDTGRVFPGILKCLTDHRPVRLSLDLGGS